MACGCGGGARRATPGGPRGPRGCVGPNCVDGKMLPGGGGRTPAGDARLLGQRAGGKEPEAMVLMRYKGAGGRSIMGVSKGEDGKARRYNFGSDRGHREKYVYQSDIGVLLASRMFEVVPVGSAETPVPLEMQEELVGAGTGA